MKNWMPFAALLLFAACNTEKKTVPTESSSELVGHWIEVMYANPQIVQGVTLKADGSANSIGMKTLLYERWQQIGDTLILSGKSVGNGQTLAFDDTLDIVRLTEDTLVVGKYGNYQRVYYRTDKVEAVDVVDSLKLIPDGGPVVAQTYKGTLPAASGPGIEYTVTIHHQEHSGDGVFQAALNYLEAENGKDRCDIIYGRQYTLRGHSGNKNATVLELISFDQSTKMYFEQKKDQLVMLDQQMNPIDSKLNYTLNRQ